MKRLLLTAALASLIAAPAFAGHIKNIGEILWKNGHDGEWRSWNNIVDDVLTLANLHDGSFLDHNCIPEEKKCADSLTIGIKNDGKWKRFSIIAFRNPRGNMIDTSVCWFSEHYDLRQCLAYGQSGEGAIEMREQGGHWQVVESPDDGKKQQTDNSF